MTYPALEYAIVTPVRNEEENLPALAQCLDTQTRPPVSWVIVDTGSTDRTLALAEALAAERPWVRLLELPTHGGLARGGPVVRAFTAGMRALGEIPDVVVKLDADVSFDANYFERLVDAFTAEPRLGIASGIGLELKAGEWRPVYGTRAHVWGASRAYRRECLDVVLPLDERQGWDEIDALKARLAGWKTRTLPEIPFRHHRPLGARDGSHRNWADQGETAYYMGYRPSYVVARTLYRLPREPQAVVMLGAFARAAARRSPRVSDARVRRYLREQQRLRALPARAREVFGRTV